MKDMEWMGWVLLIVQGIVLLIYLAIVVLCVLFACAVVGH